MQGRPQAQYFCWTVLVWTLFNVDNPLPYEEVGDKGCYGEPMLNFCMPFMAVYNTLGWSIFLKLVSLNACVAVGDN